MSAHDIEAHAELLYSRYCQATGGKAFNGDPLPDWPTFAADPKKQTQADAWRAVALESISHAANRKANTP